MLVRSSKPNTLRSSLMKTRPERVCNRWYRVSIAFLVNVAEAAMAKQADL
jgi:hypothetical protein